jgi:NAD(P)-dependent dehydrogenase (short-subunit alcohol dehydrogenase family)
MQCLVITGASSGIGYATAETFRRAGYRVINLSRSACSIDGVLNLTGDLSDPSSLPLISESLTAAVADADSLCLVHNAARLGHDTIQNIETDALRQIYEINLIAPTILNRLLLPHMTDGSSI